MFVDVVSVMFDVVVFDLGCGVGYVSFVVVLYVCDVVVYDFVVLMFVIVDVVVCECGFVNVCM